MTGWKVGKIFTVLACIAAGLLFLYALFFSNYVSPQAVAHDASLAESFLKFNILTHEEMYLSEVVPTFNGKSESFSTLVNQQFNRFLVGTPFVHKLPSAPFIFAYRLDFPAGGVTWVLWYDDGGTGPLMGPDITVTLPVPDTTVATVLTERMIQASETEPLRRGYLIEDGIAKVVIAREPIFVYLGAE